MLVTLSLKESTIVLSVSALVLTIPRFSTYNRRDTQIFLWLVENFTTLCSCSLEILIQKKQTDIGAKISNLCWYSGVHVIGPPRLEVSATPPFAQKGVGISPVKEFEIFVLAKYSLTLVTSIISHTYILRSLSYI